MRRTILALVQECAIVTEVIGIHPLFGACAFGAIVPHDSELARGVEARLTDGAPGSRGQPLARETPRPLGGTPCNYGVRRSGRHGHFFTRCSARPLVWGRALHSTSGSKMGCATTMAEGKVGAQSPVDLVARRIAARGHEAAR